MLGSISGRVDPLLLTVVFNEHQVFNNDLSNLKKKSSGILPSGFFACFSAKLSLVALSQQTTPIFLVSALYKGKFAFIR